MAGLSLAWSKRCTGQALSSCIGESLPPPRVGWTGNFRPQDPWMASAHEVDLAPKNRTQLSLGEITNSSP